MSTTSESANMPATRVATPEMSKEEEAFGKDPNAPAEKVYLTGYKLALVYVGLLLSVFLFALDQTIVATAQPKIVSKFNALDKFAWVSSAYLLTQCGLMLMVGQILTITSSKVVFMVSIFIFELGSLFCGVAPSIEFLIFGRAVAGVGAAGLFTSVITMFAEVTKLEDRPIFFAFFGATFGISSVIGPLLGGAFSDHVSWRWCFYINLPFGAITIVTIMLFIHTPSGRSKKSVFGDIPTWQKWLKLDWIGSILSLGFVTCLILGLQWGGNTKPWNSGAVIATLVLSGVLFAAFFIWEFSIGDKAMLPTHLLSRRTQLWGSIEGFFIFCTFLMGTFFLPLWYQAKGASASKAGVNILAFMLSVVVTAGIVGGIVRRTGRYWYFLLLTPLLSSIAAGLLFTIRPSTPGSRVVGFQILMGIGIGGVLQQSVLAVQTEYAREEHLIPQGTSLVNFIRTLGGIIGITVGTTVFDNQLIKALPMFAPNLTPEQSAAVTSSVSAIFTLPPALRSSVIDAYSHSLNRVFLIGVPAAALAAFVTLFMDNYNIHERSPTSHKKPKDAEKV